MTWQLRATGLLSRRHGGFPHSAGPSAGCEDGGEELGRATSDHRAETMLRRNVPHPPIQLYGRLILCLPSELPLSNSTVYSAYKLIASV